ncbi:MAG TPA: hypothetical protein VGM64_06190 [Lacunisphaera sp.]|jgi:hypothetical protein
MKSEKDSAVGRIINHANAMGLPDSADVEQRAREIARIEGHREVRDDDRRQAAQELRGNDIPPLGDEDAEGVSSLSRDPSEPASTPGQQIPERENEEEQFTTERLVAEGVSEAEHDQMLAARRRKRE